MSNLDRQETFTKAFVGKTVAWVNAEAFNVVHFTFTDGTSISIDAEEMHYGISVINATHWKDLEI